MSSTMEKSSARMNRAFAAISPELVDLLNDLAAKATVLNGGFIVTQRQVHDAMLWWAIEELGDDEAAKLGYEAAAKAAELG
jgi:hypothetical protein